MTEDSQHKNNFLKISRNLSKNNRYADILPCINTFLLKLLDQHNVALIGEEYTGVHGIKGNPTFNDTYINASYIDVINFLIISGPNN
jgi:protein tyrosine phosphatase